MKDNRGGGGGGMGGETDKSGNCVPGTVVEMEITHPYEYDFCKYYSLHTYLCEELRPPIPSEICFALHIKEEIGGCNDL